MTPLERAARALCKAAGDDWDREGPNGLFSLYATQARAVLIAIREPSEIQRNVGGYVIGQSGLAAQNSEKAELAFVAMIDAVLGETQ